LGERGGGRRTIKGARRGVKSEYYKPGIWEMFRSAKKKKVEIPPKWVEGWANDLSRENLGSNPRNGVTEGGGKIFSKGSEYIKPVGEGSRFICLGEDLKNPPTKNFRKGGLRKSIRIEKERTSATYRACNTCLS